MTSPSLIFGSILLAFSPAFALLVVIVSHKPQLVILAVCSAFAYLLSALCSSLFWLITSAIFGSDHGGGGIGALLALALPGVFCQMAARCSFVGGYFRVESVIRRSVARHEEERQVAMAAASSSSDGDGDGDDRLAESHAETDALQLQLNDLSCSIASGCGYALLHSLFLYGTLLASESGEVNSYDGGHYVGGGGSTGHGGTLYQSSCGGIPSLINGALIACMFAILDVMWMMLCFFGMRRRSSGRHSAAHPGRESSAGTMRALARALSCRGLDDASSSSGDGGGGAAILLVAITHLAASLVLAPNGREDGCKISLPCLGVVVLWVGIVLGRTMKGGKFLPDDQRRRIQGMRHMC
ncbi:hypothetical protein ACHAW5_007254 [Stephanodiscus triporus]|uniref:Uncharacterized protein n=1 Tax=Stephanodiscus triporus TaxID=2934178 RepID=A0ABD3P5W6_9STRA